MPLTMASPLDQNPTLNDLSLLTPFAAQYLASTLGMALPTKYLVDKIYDQADVKMRPQPTDWYKQEGRMRSGPNYIIFSQTIEAQRQSRLGLIAGHKKDVVLTNLLDRKPDRVAIYGWQRPGNVPIQPLATPHVYTYEDYSHGIRFVGPMVRVTDSTGRSVYWNVRDALHDADLGAVLNGGQAIADVRAGRRCTPEFLQFSGLTPSTCPPQPRNCPLQTF